MQVAIADIEDRLFASQLKSIEIKRPVFVTALPRAGTTLLLEILESLPEFASHTYRHMPFVLCPMLWHKFSSKFSRSVEAQERAHQDGMLVTTESPEAFEEIIWKAFWRDRYRTDRILLWAEDDPDFMDFFRSHMQKIILLSETGADGHRRYLSKNNLNISRIDFLARNFPDAAIVVPFRDPIQHAASLLHQHTNFLKMHKEDPFSRQYMAGIGHFDFGENLRPVNFDGWLDRADFNDPSQLSFWLEYWYETYCHLNERVGVKLYCYEDLCADPSAMLARLADILRPVDRTALLDQSRRFRTPRPHSVSLPSDARLLANRAEDLYQSMRRRSGLDARA